MWGQKYQSNEEEVEGSTKCSDNSGGKEKELADGVVSPSGRIKMTVDRQLLYKAVGYVYSKLVMPGEDGGQKREGMEGFHLAFEGLIGPE